MLEPQAQLQALHGLKVPVTRQRKAMLAFEAKGATVKR